MDPRGALLVSGQLLICAIYAVLVGSQGLGYQEQMYAAAGRQAQVHCDGACLSGLSCVDAAGNLHSAWAGCRMHDKYDEQYAAAYERQQAFTTSTSKEL